MLRLSLLGQHRYNNNATIPNPIYANINNPRITATIISNIFNIIIIFLYPLFLFEEKGPSGSRTQHDLAIYSFADCSLTTRVMGHNVPDIIPAHYIY